MRLVVLAAWGNVRAQLPEALAMLQLAILGSTVMEGEQEERTRCCRVTSRFRVSCGRCVVMGPLESVSFVVRNAQLGMQLGEGRNSNRNSTLQKSCLHPAPFQTVPMARICFRVGSAGSDPLAHGLDSPLLHLVLAFTLFLPSSPTWVPPDGPLVTTASINDFGFCDGG